MPLLENRPGDCSAWRSHLFCPARGLVGLWKAGDVGISSVLYRAGRGMMERVRECFERTLSTHSPSIMSSLTPLVIPPRPNF